MRILYGVSGVGLGHSSRAKEIISFLEKEGHKVLVFTYGEAYPVLKSEFNVYKIYGIPLHFKEGKLVLTKTFYHGAKSVLNNLLSAGKIKKRLSEFRPEVCITDMEPFTSLISKLLRIPLISLNNQHMLTTINLDIPRQYRNGAFIAKTATKFSALRANKYIILSFLKEKKTKDKNISIVGPILRKEILKLKPSKNNFTLVYQATLSKDLLEILKESSEKFIVYTYTKNKANYKNIKIKKIGKNFIKDLAKTKAVIGTAGFSLISEALYLKKPYFAIPLKSQFEQTFNAVFLKHAKIGDFSENPTKQEIQHFLNNLKTYESNLKKHRINPQEAILALSNTLKSIELSRNK